MIPGTRGLRAAGGGPAPDPQTWVQGLVSQPGKGELKREITGGGTILEVAV